VAAVVPADVRYALREEATAAFAILSGELLALHKARLFFFGGGGRVFFLGGAFGLVFGGLVCWGCWVLLWVF
jgi:hypothetical protein